MDKKTIEQDLVKLTQEFVKFYAKDLPTLGQNVGNTLKGKHDEAVETISQLVNAEQEEPAEPTYEKFNNPKLVAQAEEDEEAAEKLESQMRAVKRRNSAKRAAYNQQHQTW